MRLMLSGMLAAVAMRLKQLDCLPQDELAAVEEDKTEEEAATVIQSFWRSIWIRIYAGMVEIDSHAAMGGKGILCPCFLVRVLQTITNAIYTRGVKITPSPMPRLRAGPRPF